MVVCRQTDPEKYLLRRRPATLSLRLNIFLLIAALVSGSAGFAQEPEIHPADASLDRFLTEATTLQADFEQELRDSDGEIIEVAVGSLSLRRPNQFFWEYREPLEQVILADGENLWIYDVDLAQATVTPLDELASATPAMLLSGDIGIRGSFEAIEYFSAEGTDWVQLAPTESGADFRSILVGFSAGELVSLELLAALDQVTRIDFADVVENAELSADQFLFDPPRGVDVIGEPR